MWEAVGASSAALSLSWQASDVCVRVAAGYAGCVMHFEIVGEVIELECK